MDNQMTFEQALANLERIVAELEKGQLTLEESIARFEEGVALAGQCSKLLKAAELKVRRLAKRAEGTFDLEEWTGIRPERGVPSDGQDEGDAGRED